MGQAIGEQTMIRTRTCWSPAEVGNRGVNVRPFICALSCCMQSSLRTMKAALAPIAMPYALHAAWGKISPVVAYALRHGLVLSLRAPVEGTHHKQTNRVSHQMRGRQ